MSLSKQFQEMLAFELKQAGQLRNDPYGRAVVRALAERTLFSVDREAPDHIKILINSFSCGVVNLGYEPLTVYGCDLLDELMPGQWEKTDQHRRRLLAKLRVAGQDGSTIH